MANPTFAKREINSNKVVGHRISELLNTFKVTLTITTILKPAFEHNTKCLHHGQSVIASPEKSPFPPFGGMGFDIQAPN